MSKTEKLVRCKHCGYVSAKWMGRCPDCGEWDSFVEELEDVSSQYDKYRLSTDAPQPISVIPTALEERHSTGISEFDRVLGGGIVPGSLVLLGGQPGIGKSTLLLQVAQNVAASKKVLMVSGEESSRQIRMRADRVRALSSNLFLYCETDIQAIIEKIEKLQPQVVIVDSIQTAFSAEVGTAPGSVSQIRECTSYLTRIAKSERISIFIVGHVTKEGSIAGPRVLEHMVDTVLYFEGDSQLHYRLIRAVKNRYGSTNEIGVFEMGDNGLAEVCNPSEIFLSQRSGKLSGSVIIPTMEGTRPVLVELQALVAPTSFAAPRRLVTGFDYNRFLLILAVLEKKAGLRLENKDVFASVAGGLKVYETAADLGAAAAVFSAYKDIPLDKDLVVFGEVGLTGEIRLAAQAEKRLQEATKLGFKKAVMPKPNTKLDKDLRAKSLVATDIKQALKYLS